MKGAFLLRMTCECSAYLNVFPRLQDHAALVQLATLPPFRFSLH